MLSVEKQFRSDIDELISIRVKDAHLDDDLYDKSIESIIISQILD